MRFLFKEVCKVKNARCLTPVCKQWFIFLRESNVLPQEKLGYATMNPFMKDCMELYWRNLFDNGILYCTPSNGGSQISLPFSNLHKTAGTFNLSAFGDVSPWLIITTNMDRFYLVGGENKGKAVMLIKPRYVIEQESKKPSNTYPLDVLLAQGNADQNPIIIVWRWGGSDDLTCIDHLTTATILEISSRSLCENWRLSTKGGVSGLGATAGVLKVDFMCFPRIRR